MTWAAVAWGVARGLVFLAVAFAVAIAFEKRM